MVENILVIMKWDYGVEKFFIFLFLEKFMMFYLVVMIIENVCGYGLVMLMSLCLDFVLNYINFMNEILEYVKEVLRISIE